MREYASYLRMCATVLTPGVQANGFLGVSLVDSKGVCPAELVVVGVDVLCRQGLEFSGLKADHSLF